MTVRTSTLSWGSGTGTSWSRRVVVLVTAAATALGLAVVVGPGADAAGKPPPTYVGDLRITLALDDETDLPVKAPADDAVGFVIPNQDYTIVVETRQLGSATAAYMVERDADITVSDGTRAYQATIEAGGSSATITGARWPSSSNFTLTASANKQAELKPDTLPVTVALNSKNVAAPSDGSFVTLDDCVLSKDNPTCVRLSVPGGTGGAVTLLSTSECADFLGGTETNITCRKGKGSDPAVALVAQTFVDLADEQMATIILDCDKSLCGNGGVASFVPLFDKGNTGTFETLDECPAKNTLGSLGACFDKAQSTRDNAGDLHTYILFDDDARTLH